MKEWECGSEKVDKRSETGVPIKLVKNNLVTLS